MEMPETRLRVDARRMSGHIPGTMFESLKGIEKKPRIEQPELEPGSYERQQTFAEVDLTVTEHNNGDVDLTSPYVNVSPGGYSLNKASAYYVSGDTGDDGILGTGETWTWVITGVVVNADTTFTANGHGLDPLLNGISFVNGYTGEQDTVAIDVIPAEAGIYSYLIILDPRLRGDDRTRTISTFDETVNVRCSKCFCGLPVSPDRSRPLARPATRWPSVCCSNNFYPPA